MKMRIHKRLDKMPLRLAKAQDRRKRTKKNQKRKNLLDQ